MTYLFPRIMVLGLLAEITVSCGETVNYDTEAKVATALVVPNNTGGDSSKGSDAAAGANGVEAPNSGISGSSGSPDADLPAACLTSPVQVKQDALVFPEIAAGTTCSFGSGDNLTKKDGYFRAYLRQTQTVTLPDGAILCGINLVHNPAAMRYDDEMFFSVNDKLLLATKDYSDIFPKTDFFQSFSWANLVNKKYDSVENRPVFCAGAKEGISSCGVPTTETQGNIEMNFSEAMNVKLSTALRADRDLVFEWITTGDNDNSDCRHTEIDLDLELRYVMP